MIERYKIQERILNLFEQLDDEDKVMIWGAGEHTVALFNFLNEKNISFHYIQGIISSYQEHQQIMGVKVYSIQEALNLVDYIKYIIVSSYSFQEEILHELEKLGLRSKAFVLYNMEDFDPLFYWKVRQHYYYNYEDIPADPVIHNVKMDNIAFKMKLNLREFIQNTIYNYGYYEKNETQFLLKKIQAGQTVFDLGANVGYYTLMLAQKVGSSGTIHSFEPDSKNFRQLIENIHLNQLLNVVANQVAASNSNSYVTLYSNSDEHGGMKSFMQQFEHVYAQEKVETIRLDDYIKQNKIDKVDFIKSDIEGAEMLAFQGAENLLSSSDAPDIMLEINPIGLSKLGFSDIELQKLLIDYGYKIYLIEDSGTLKHIQSKIKVEKSINVFATKKEI
ncbi:FkbM family methyltransferase [Bacillus smithii]|uniref:FkbM family methyltransferase n=1 Tax=Bacillus smithii TaxID=1479 RepID=UPI00065E68B2|nr:FkbM family methyltransferase [Bacillus smithii]AKP48487.1 methyltransferaseFkbM family domain protein [Bacillus smithii]